MATIRFGPVPPKQQNFCKDCKYFVPPLKYDLKYGNCRKFGTLDLVTGEKTYLFASTAREHDCKGKHFEKLEFSRGQDEDDSDHEQYEKPVPCYDRFLSFW